MTKGKFIANALDMCIFGGDSKEAKRIFDEFFESNVVIPKGKNPHRYQDELHKLAEGIYNCECQIELLRPSNIEQVTLKFNIKPKPIYEWQWCVIMDDGTGSIFGFHTEEAINGIFPNRKKIRLGDTMKERKL